MKTELIDKRELRLKMYAFIVEGAKEKDTSKEHWDSRFLCNRWGNHILGIIDDAPVIEIKED